MSARVLVVENEFMIGLDVSNQLTSAGYEVVGLATSVRKALRLEPTCDVAVLDANLRGDSAAPMAMALRERGRPFLFVSGFERAYLPAAFLDEPLLSKPFEPGELIAAVTRLLSGAHTREDYSRSRPESH